MRAMLITRIPDADLAQAAWMVGCQATGSALIIDPLRDVDRYIEAAAAAGLRITHVAETHIHADFLSGSAALADLTGAKCMLSACGGEDWSYTWPANSSLPVQLVGSGDTFSVGDVAIDVVHTPGHTPEHICFHVHDGQTDDIIGLVSGDFVFAGNLGRPDLLETAAGIEGAMEASARDLHASALQFLELSDHLAVWPGHGAGSACGKAMTDQPSTSVGQERHSNPALAVADDQAAFIAYMLDSQPSPPLHFARMKRRNRDGVPPLASLPAPSQIMQVTDLPDECVVIDTRPWPQVAAGHIPGSIWAPLGNWFHDFAGSYVDPDDAIALIVEEASLDRAVRGAVRIGLDHLVAWAPPDVLTAAGGLATMDELAAQDAETSIASDAMAVLDVRRGDERDAGHIDGSTHVPHTRLLAHLDDLDADRPLLVHCAGGLRSAAACMALRRHGYHVTNLAGGYAAWSQLATAR